MSAIVEGGRGVVPDKGMNEMTNLGSLSFFKHIERVRVILTVSGTLLLTNQELA